jgi:hypothetical protein
MYVCDLLSLASPAATVLAAGVAVYVTWSLGKGQLRIAEQQKDIAHRQAELAAVRLQHDRYDRRFQIYDAARTLLIHIIQQAAISREEIYVFIRGTADAIFLLDDDLVSYFREWQTRAFRLEVIASVIDAPRGSLTREQLIEEKFVIFHWFESQFDVLITKFKPFLRLPDTVIDGTSSHDSSLGVKSTWSGLSRWAASLHSRITRLLQKLPPRDSSVR